MEGLEIFLIIGILACFILWPIFHALRGSFPGRKKELYVLFMIFFPLFGIPYYLLVGRYHRKPKP